MESLRQLPVLVLVVLTYSAVTVNGQDWICFNITANSAFQRSLYSLLDSISTTNSTTLDYGFFNASTSQQQNSEAIEAIGYCRGDLDGDACRACLKSSASQITQLCPIQKKAVMFEENCTLKYYNGSLYGVLDTSWNAMPLNPRNVSNWVMFSTALKQLLSGLQGNASSGGTLRKYAAGSTSVELNTLYAAVQCSPDLGAQQCSDCLDIIPGYIPPGRMGAKGLFPSCQLRYETYRFFDPTIALPSQSPPPATAAVPPASTPPGGTGEKKSSEKWIVVVASSVTAILLIGIIVFFLIVKRRKRRFSRRLRNEEDDDVIMVESLQFNLGVIVEATENFSDSKKLGQGGFGSVYLGKLPNGEAIAVKRRLSQNSGQGELEFKNEVVLLARLQHRNLVRLLGFCLEGGERLLIYEFVPNSSLDRFIFDPIKRACLDWDTRYKIIMGIARGLLYLHQDSRLRIIHRDLKASNILLDGDMSPKVSDFGTARLFELDQTQADTNRVVGTYGYMAPEYGMHGRFSSKSDVYSFGVLLLEVVSGRKNNDMRSRPGGDPESLICHVWRSFQEGKISDIIDPLVATEYSTNILRCIHIGLLCVQENMSSRPTMASVIEMLNSDSASLPKPTQPAFLLISEGPSPHSVNGLTITEPYPR